MARLHSKRGPMHEKARGLVDRDQAVVLIKDAERAYGRPPRMCSSEAVQPPVTPCWTERPEGSSEK